MPANTKIAKIADAESCAYVSGCDLYILDGEGITRVGGDGSVDKIGQGDAMGYLPTTYVNGERYEQRNLLSKSFKEIIDIASPDEFSLGSEGLTFNILSLENRTCEITGVSADFVGDLYVPAYTEIARVKYRVVSVAPKAFFNHTGIRSVHLPASCVTLGERAFFGCEELTSLYLSDRCEVIGYECFNSCINLTELYLGSSLVEVCEDAFILCERLDVVNYGGNSVSLKAVKGSEQITFFEVNYNSKYPYVNISLPVCSNASVINSLDSDGKAVAFEEKKEGARVCSVEVYGALREVFEGMRVVISGSLLEEYYEEELNGFTNVFGREISATQAIMGCRVAECFDGRVFLSGNPSLPNTVFYSERDGTGLNNPLYFGAYNYFNDGMGNYPVSSMLAVKDALAVFKAGDDGSGTIYYHVPEATGENFIPKVYPVSYIHSGVAAVGPSISFYDDPIFISKMGVCALESSEISGSRRISVRSHNVNPKLLAEELALGSLARWRGYLCVLMQGNIYLADSRQTFTHQTKNREYEWYFLSGIGTYENTAPIYRFSSEPHPDYKIYEGEISLIEGEVYSAPDSNGEVIYYTVIDGNKYRAEPSGERRGLGSFSPAVKLYCTENDLLFFGTESGNICLFNTDKRGTPPEYLANKQDFDPEQYRAAWGKRIHPHFYTFDGISPRYAAKTVSDNCGAPHLAKNTVKHSLTLKILSFGDGGITVEVASERGGYREVCTLPDFAFSFDELGFDKLTFENMQYLTVPLPEKEKGWVEKQIAIYSDSRGGPFGLCSITYRYVFKGKISLK